MKISKKAVIILIVLAILAAGIYFLVLQVRGGIVYAKYDEAMNYLGNQKYQEAIIEFKKLAEMAPTSRWEVEAYYRIGMIHHMIWGEYDKAFDYYKKALAIDPDGDSGMVWSNIGELYLKQGKIDDAVAALKKSAEYDAHRALDSVYFRLGLAYQQKGDIEKAIKSYKKCLTLRSDQHAHIAETAVHNLKVLEQTLQQNIKAGAN